MYNCLPMYHSVGGAVATGAVLVNGGSVVIRDKFSAAAFWEDIRRYDCTMFQYIGELCRYLLNAPWPLAREMPPKIRLCCGNGLRADIWEPFKKPPFQVRSATVQHGWHGGVNGRGKGRGQGL
jgi:fatty-acyl-CoA synthase